MARCRSQNKLIVTSPNHDCVKVRVARLGQISQSNLATLAAVVTLSPRLGGKEIRGEEPRGPVGEGATRTQSNS